MSAGWDAAAWAALAAELDRWGAAGDVATVWWRDDDAGPGGPALDRLLALAATAGVPLGLAVVPAWLDGPGAAAIAAAAPGVVALQHGLAHVNHEPPPAAGARARKAELGAGRPPAAAVADVAAGGAWLRARLGARWRPVLVPPWNRIAPAVAAALPGLGYRALSAMGPRPGAEAAPGLRALNCHVDPIRWRDGRRFAGPGWTLAALAAHLAARRTGELDPAEPTGLLTHHQDLGPAAWACLAELLPRLRGHRAVRFPPVDALLGGPA